MSLVARILVMFNHEENNMAETEINVERVRRIAVDWILVKMEATDTVNA
jgi:hypothetical protein